MIQTIEFTLPELLERVTAGQIPMNAKIQVTFDPTSSPASEPPIDATLALFAQWDKEDAQITPEEQSENERIYAEIEKNGIPRVRI